MNSLEEQLRDAYQEAARTVRPHSVPELDLAPARRSWAARHRAGLRVLAPLAAAAAVAAIVVAVTGIAQLPGGQPSSHPSRPPRPAAATEGPPPYFIKVIRSDRGDDGLGVFSARTGQLTELIKTPQAGGSFSGAAAISRPRTFLVSAVGLTGCYTLFYRLTLSPRGALASLSPLAVPRVSGAVTATLTASADGQVIGYDAGSCVTNEPSGSVGVIRLPTRQIRTWGHSGGVTSLAMSANGRTLDLVTTTNAGLAGPVFQLRTSSPAGGLAQQARVLLPAGRGVSTFDSIALINGGRVLLACTEQPDRVVLARYDAATGKELPPLGVRSRKPGTSCGITVAPSGRYVLVNQLADAVYRTMLLQIDLRTGHTRLVPGAGADVLPAAFAW